MPIRLLRRTSSIPVPFSTFAASTSTTTNRLRSAMPVATSSLVHTPSTNLAAAADGASLPQCQLLSPPKSDPPVLLLQGDELHVSPQGVARSCYRLGEYTDWKIEEHYNLQEHTKSFVVSTPVQEFTIDIQEIDTQKAGTGGTTWEASIAMALYFANHPGKLNGKVVELGSGVGVGGILLDHLVSTEQHSSITLTDGNSKVLEQCRANASKHQRSYLKTKLLDWNEILKPNSNNEEISKYNTVLACDCAYRSKDVPGLAQTLKALLSKRENDKNQIHLFGPYNRAAYHEAIQWLQNDEELNVQVEWIELERYRLYAGQNAKSSSNGLLDATSVTDPFWVGSSYKAEKREDSLENSSRSTTKFIHVTATNKTYSEDMAEQPKYSSMSDID